MYLWNWIWPTDGKMVIGGFPTGLKSARVLASGQELAFTQEKYRIIFNELPKDPPDSIAGVAVVALEFEKTPEFIRFAAIPPLNRGRIYD